MNAKKKVNTLINYYNFLVGVVGGLCFGGLGIFIIILTLSRGPQIYIGLIFGIIFSVFGLIGFLLTLFIDLFEIDNEKLVVKNIFGRIKKIIYLNEIHSYNEIKKHNKYFTWYDLTLFLIDSKLKISSSNYLNYPELRALLISGKERDLASEKEWHRKNERYLGIGFTTFGSFIAIILFLHALELFETGYVGTFWLGLLICFFMLGYGIYLLRISKK